MALDRSSIQRSDFPTVRRGYDPAAVDRHLSDVADQMEGARRSAGQPVAAAASAQVQRIIEAAESTAEQLRTEAGDEAREHVHRVSTAARELLERIGAMHDELGALMDRMREEAGRLSTELRSLERDVGEIGAAPGEAEAVEELAAPEPAAGSRAATPASARPDPAPAEASVDAAPADAEPPADAAPSPDPRPEDEEDARIVALDMALAGTPREETERYLADHYSLADPGALLDDVYALAGS